MRKSIRLLLCAALMLTGLTMSAARAELPWPVAETSGMTAAQSYVTGLNADLTARGLAPFNSLFEAYATMASLGVTTQDNSELPEDIQLTLYMNDAEPTRLTLGTSRLDLFSSLAACCIHAADPSATTLEGAMSIPAAWVKKAQDSPGNSFTEEVDELRSGNVRCYYSYTPSLYGSGTCWMTLDLIFPIAGGAVIAEATPPPTTPEPTNAPDISSDDDPSVLVDSDPDWSMGNRLDYADRVDVTVKPSTEDLTTTPPPSQK